MRGLPFYEGDVLCSRAFVLTGNMKKGSHTVPLGDLTFGVDFFMSIRKPSKGYIYCPI